MSKPREFKLVRNIRADGLIVYPDNFDSGDSYEIIHVIEKSAADKLADLLELTIGGLRDRWLVDVDYCERQLKKYRGEK